MRIKVFGVLVAIAALAAAGAASALDRAGPPREGTEAVSCVFNKGQTVCVVVTFEYLRTDCGPAPHPGLPPYPLYIIDWYEPTGEQLVFKGNRTAGQVRYDAAGRPFYDDYKRKGGHPISRSPYFLATFHGFDAFVGPQCGFVPAPGS